MLSGDHCQLIIMATSATLTDRKFHILDSFFMMGGFSWTQNLSFLCTLQWGNNLQAP